MRVLEDQSTPGATSALQQRVAEALTTGHPRVVLDMRAAALGGTAEFCSFSVVLRRLADAGARLTVVGLPPHIRRVLELCAIPGLEVAPAADPDDRRTARDRPHPVPPVIEATRVGSPPSLSSSQRAAHPVHPKPSRTCREPRVA